MSHQPAQTWASNRHTVRIKTGDDEMTSERELASLTPVAAWPRKVYGPRLIPSGLPKIPPHQIIEMFKNYTIALTQASKGLVTSIIFLFPTSLHFNCLTNLYPPANSLSSHGS